MAKLEYVEGIGAKYADKLRKAGIASTNALFEKAKTPAGRKEIAKDSAISEKLILEWANHLDLMRIKGVGSEFADLLEAAGVDTVVEFKKRKPDNLHATLLETNAKKKLVRRVPGLEQLKKWIAEAAKLDRAIKY